MNNITIELSNVDSSNIKYLLYQGNSKGLGTLKVDFSTGVSYEYLGVECNIVLQIINAESIGKVFKTLIIANGKYQYRRL